MQNGELELMSKRSKKKAAALSITKGEIKIVHVQGEEKVIETQPKGMSDERKDYIEAMRQVSKHIFQGSFKVYS